MLKKVTYLLFLKSSGDSAKRGYGFVFELIKTHRWFLVVLLCFGLIVGFIEGAAIGLIAYSAIVVTGDSGACSELLQKIASYTSTSFCDNYDKYKIFLYLIYASIIIQLIKSIFVYCSGFLGTVLRTRVIYEVRHRVINKMIHLDYQDSSILSAGEKQLVISSSAKLASLVPVVNNVIVTMSVLLFYVAILVKMDWKLTIWAVILLLFLLLVAAPFIEKIRRISFQIRANSKIMLKKVIDYMFALRLIKLYGQNKEVMGELDHIIRKEVGYVRTSALYKVALDPTQETIVMLSVGAMLLFSFFSAGEKIDQFLPTTLAYVLVLHRCNNRVTTLNNIRSAFANAMSNVQYVTDFLYREPTIDRKGFKPIKDEWSKITVDNMSFSYSDSDSEVLSEISMKITRGTRIAIVGSSGAGKSTLVDVLVGLLLPTKGHVFIDDVSSHDALMSNWVAQFSMVSQNDLILNDTIKKNLQFANKSASDEDIVKACDIAQASEFIEELGGYDALLGERGNKISGGQIQRIAFARAILKDAPVLILDEATSALDSITEKKIVNKLRELDSRKTIIAIAHRISTVVDSDVIYVVQDGRLLASGTHEELLKKNEFYLEMWNSQELPTEKQ